MAKESRLTPWGRVLSILGKSRGARLLALGIFLLFSGTISVFAWRAVNSAAAPSDLGPGSYFLILGMVLVLWGAQVYLAEEK